MKLQAPRRQSLVMAHVRPIATRLASELVMMHAPEDVQEHVLENVYIHARVRLRPIRQYSPVHIVQVVMAVAPHVLLYVAQIVLARQCLQQMDALAVILIVILYAHLHVKIHVRKHVR